MKRPAFLLLIIVCLLPARAFALVERTTLNAALMRGSITLNAVASGNSYYDKGLRLTIKNKTAKNVQIVIDPALVFRPEDTTYQDLILPGDTMIFLAAHEETAVDLQSFCGKSYAHAPAAGLSFTYANQGDSVMIQVAHFINKHRLYNSTGQNAIWALTDHHQLSAVYDPAHPEVYNKLVALMAQLTGWAIPDYFRLYKINTEAGEQVLEQRLLKIYSAFAWQLSEPKRLTLGIYNSAGKLIQPVIDDQEFIKGGYKLTVTFEAEHIAPGNYYIRLKDGAKVMKEQMVQLD